MEVKASQLGWPADAPSPHQAQEKLESCIVMDVPPVDVQPNSVISRHRVKLAGSDQAMLLKFKQYHPLTPSVEALNCYFHSQN
jgi:hypothetical protein